MKFSHRRGEHDFSFLRATIEATFDDTASRETFADQVSVGAARCYKDNCLAVQNNIGLHFTESVD